MASLADLSLLLVEDDVDSREMLEMFLTDQGASVTVASTAAEARSAIDLHAPDVILTDITLPDEDGFSFIAALRADAVTRHIPAIALTGHADAASRHRALEAGFQKFVTKPFDLFSLPAAIASVVEASRTSLDETADTRILRLIAERDMRALLATLNAATPYRFTSILRFDGDTLESVWTFDRANQSVDPFPSDMPVAASYCAFVRDTRAPFQINDAAADPRVASHPKRQELRAYCGVPILRSDGSLFGTLCHYDAAPQAVFPETVATMRRIAEMLAPVLGHASQAPLGSDRTFPPPA